MSDTAVNPKGKAFQTWILWGESPDHGEEPVRYGFDTEAELNAFYQGMEQASGHQGWKVVDGPGRWSKDDQEFLLCPWMDPEYFKPYERVKYGVFDAFVVRHCEGAMWEIGTPGGKVCVSGNELIKKAV